MFKTLTLVAVAAAFTAGTASAVTVSRGGTIFADQFVSDSATLSMEDEAFFQYTAGEDLFIPGIAVAGTGSNNGQDLSTTEYGLTAPDFNEDDPSTPDFDPATTFFFEITQRPGPTASGGGGFETNQMPNGGMFSDGDTFTIFFLDGRDSPVTVGASFQTEQPDMPAVPVPAALPLLAGALGALGLIRRRAAA